MNPKCKPADVMNEEWAISSDGKGIQTAHEIYWPQMFKKNGELRKGAKPKSMVLHYESWNPGRRKRQFMKHIVLVHNMWINRDDPARQRTVLDNMISEATKQIRRSVGCELYAPQENGNEG